MQLYTSRHDDGEHKFVVFSGGSTAKTPWTFPFPTPPAPYSLCSCPPLSWHGMNALLYRRVRGRLCRSSFACRPRLRPQPTVVVTKRACVSPNAGPTHTHTLSHMDIEWGFDSGRKRLYWYTGQACLWHHCCRCYSPPRERIIKEAQTLCLHTALWRALLQAGLWCKPTDNNLEHRLSVLLMLIFFLFEGRFSAVSLITIINCCLQLLFNL